MNLWHLSDIQRTTNSIEFPCYSNNKSFLILARARSLVYALHTQNKTKKQKQNNVQEQLMMMCARSPHFLTEHLTQKCGK